MAKIALFLCWQRTDVLCFKLLDLGFLLSQVFASFLKLLLEEGGGALRLLFAYLQILTDKQILDFSRSLLAR